MDSKEAPTEPILDVRRRRRDFDESSLFEMVASSIVKQSAFFCQAWHDSSVNLFSSLPNSLRAHLIHRNSYDLRQDNSCELLRLLLNKEVGSVLLSNVPTTDQNAITRLWIAMSRQCPELDTLVCRNFLDSDGLSTFFSCALHFKQLRNLDVPDLRCDNFRLFLIAKYLPQLQVLRVALTPSVTTEGIASLASLEQLHEFLYYRKHEIDNEPLPTRNQTVYSMCLQVLPRLRVSCSRIKIEHVNDFLHNEFAWKSLQQERLGAWLGLRQLVLRDACALPVGVAMPHLTTLSLMVPREHFRLPSCCSELRELGLVGVQQQLLLRLLQQVGRQLLKLAVSTSDNLHLDVVLPLCPKLRTLCVFDSPPSTENVARPLPSLAELRLVMRNDGVDCSVQLLPLLRALPNLSVLRLQNVVLQQRDDALYGDALKRGELLQQLQTFSCCYEWRERAVEGRMRTLLQSTHAVFCHLIDHCPNLCDVNVQSLE